MYRPRRRYTVVFLTKKLSVSADTIAELYRNRWREELFFKWIKLHLRIKKFWGTSENAVRIQIYCAIITYCLVAIVQHDMKLERSIYEVHQILGISLAYKTHLRDLFDKSNFKNINDPYGSNEPNLFNFLPRPFLVDSSDIRCLFRFLIYFYCWMLYCLKEFSPFIFFLFEEYNPLLKIVTITK